jgi:hypothetical protein
MPEKKITLNRFPLFGLFAYRAARQMGYTEEDARLLGYSTALLYAIYKAKAQARKEKPESEAQQELPKEIEARTKPLQFGGQEFQVIYSEGKRLKQTVVGHKVHDPKDYNTGIEAKFPEGWHQRLAKAFDKYLAAYDADQLNQGSHLFDLYKAGRDETKVGFNRVDLEKLIDWLEEHAPEKSRR